MSSSRRWRCVLAGYLPGWPGLLLASLILMSSLFHFSDTESKTDDYCFVGFPAIWNVVAFYIFAFDMAAGLAAARRRRLRRADLRAHALGTSDADAGILGH